MILGRINRRRAALFAAGAIVLIALAVLANTLAATLGLVGNARTPQELSALLRPGYRFFRPAGDGPFPTALLFSGCDGPKDNIERLAGALNKAGWAAVSVDSHGPRGHDRANQWRLVCAGQILTGAERAGDVAVALSDVRRMALVDPRHLALIGASHGGWAVLDLLAVHGQGRLPYNLSAWPSGDREHVLEGVRAVVLLYPYCGQASQVRRHGWTADIPLLFILVQGDTIASEAPCRRLVERMHSLGRPVDEILLSGVTHGFDQVAKSAFSTLAFDPAATATATGIIIDFVTRAAE